LPTHDYTVAVDYCGLFGAKKNEVNVEFFMRNVYCLEHWITVQELK